MRADLPPYFLHSLNHKSRALNDFLDVTSNTRIACVLLCMYVYSTRVYVYVCARVCMCVQTYYSRRREHTYIRNT